MKKLGIFLITLCTLVSLSACGSNGNGDNQTNVDRINMKEDAGNLEYIGYEYASRDFYYNHDSDGYSADKTVFIKFKYTNNDNVEKKMAEDYDIKVYQGGSELPYVLNFNQSYAPEEYLNVYHRKTVIKDGTMDVAIAAVFNSDSDITIAAKYKGSSGSVQSMTINFENIPDYSQTLDIKRKDLFGTWVGINDGRILELTDTNLKIKHNSSTSSGITCGSWNIKDNHITVSTVIMLDVVEIDGTIHLIAREDQFDELTDDFVKQ